VDDKIKLETLKSILDNAKAEYSIFTHDVSFTSAESGAKHFGISLAETTPTIILKAKDGYFAAIICGNTRISFKKLKQALGVSDISMADPQTVFNVTGAKIGEVSLVNSGLPTLIDHNVLKNENCYGGCGVPKTTLRINAHDLVKVTNAQILDFADVRS